jgi:hypothetical protein
MDDKLEAASPRPRPDDLPSALRSGRGPVRNVERTAVGTRCSHVKLKTSPRRCATSPASLTGLSEPVTVEVRGEAFNTLAASIGFYLGRDILALPHGHQRHGRWSAFLAAASTNCLMSERCPAPMCVAMLIHIVGCVVEVDLVGRVDGMRGRGGPGPCVDFEAGRKPDRRNLIVLPEESALTHAVQMLGVRDGHNRLAIGSLSSLHQQRRGLGQVRIRWRGAGILVMFLWFAAIGICIYGLLRIFPNTANSSHAAGLAVLGIIVGSLLASPAAYLLGLALNRRRARDGSWHWTDRHEFMDQPVEEWWKYVLGAVLLAPCVTAGAVPKWATWTLLGVWLILIMIGAVVVGSWQSKRDEQKRAQSATAPPAAP